MTVTGFIAYAQGWGGLYIRANKLAWKLIDAHPGLGIKNRFGIPDCPERVHWEEEFAHEVGAPGAYDYGPERASWLTHHLHQLDGRRRLPAQRDLQDPPPQSGGRHPVHQGQGDAQVRRGRPAPGRDRAGGAATRTTSCRSSAPASSDCRAAPSDCVPDNRLAPTTMPARSRGAMTGLKVVDLSRACWPVRYCAQMLADHGADVDQRSSHRSGDETRRLGPPTVRRQRAGGLLRRRQSRQARASRSTLTQPDARATLEVLLSRMRTYSSRTSCPGTLERWNLAAARAAHGLQLQLRRDEVLGRRRPVRVRGRDEAQHRLRLHRRRLPRLGESAIARSPVLMRRVVALVVCAALAVVGFAAGCGGTFKMPTETPKAEFPPTRAPAAGGVVEARSGSGRCCSSGNAPQLFLLPRTPAAAPAPRGDIVSGRPLPPHGPAAADQRHPLSHAVPARWRCAAAATASAAGRTGSTCSTPATPASARTNSRRFVRGDAGRRLRALLARARVPGCWRATRSRRSATRRSRRCRASPADETGRVYVSCPRHHPQIDPLNPSIRTRLFQWRIYRYLRGSRYPGIFPPDPRMPGSNWYRDTTWEVRQPEARGPDSSTIRAASTGRPTRSAPCMPPTTASTASSGGRPASRARRC